MMENPLDARAEAGDEFVDEGVTSVGKLLCGKDVDCIVLAENQDRISCGSFWEVGGVFCPTPNKG